MRRKISLFLLITLIISSLILLFPSQILGLPLPEACSVNLSVKAGDTETPSTFKIVLTDLDPKIVYAYMFFLFKYNGTFKELFSEADPFSFLIYVKGGVAPAGESYRKTFNKQLGKGRYLALVFAGDEGKGEEDLAFDYARFRVSEAEEEVEPEKQSVTYSKTPLGFIMYMYRHILLRDGEEESLNAWLDGLNSGAVTAADLVKSFIFSEECGARFLEYSNEEFITFLYKVLLGREPEESGFNEWLALMNAGMTREEVVDIFTRSEEFANLWKLFGVTPYPGYTDTGQ